MRGIESPEVYIFGDGSVSFQKYHISQRKLVGQR
jgi:hypothetical protein